MPGLTIQCVAFSHSHMSSAPVNFLHNVARHIYVGCNFPVLSLDHRCAPCTYVLLFIQ